MTSKVPITVAEPVAPSVRQTLLKAHPADGGLGIHVPLTSSPIARSSYFCSFLFFQPLPAAIGGAISGGSMGNPASLTLPAGSGDAADASWTGMCAAASTPVAAG